MSRPKLLGVLLCYNDGDLLSDSIRYLLEQKHDLIVWDHGSTDETPAVIEQFRESLIEVCTIPREFDFYQLYPAMSDHLKENYTKKYDWISWPDQDEFLEGPSRSKAYCEWLEEAIESPYDWIQFNNYNFWLTDADDPSIPSAPARIRHYALFPDCAPRIRSWRAAATNERIFNHNAPNGNEYPARFNLRHYPMRSPLQVNARLYRDRAGLRRGVANYHYENMVANPDALRIRSEQLHYDDGISELNPAPIFNWRSVYGSGPKTLS